MVDANKLRRIEDCKGRMKDIVGYDGVLQLARDGVCPHYIITNPITKEESIWFVPSEINNWFEENYVRYSKGYYTPEFTFVHFDKEANRCAGDVPLELSRIRDLYQLPIEHINTPPGVYFLCKGDKIKYIGQASNVSGRIVTHISEGMKDFDKVYYITCGLNRLNEMESALIRYLQPEYNKTKHGIANGRDKIIVSSLNTR